MSWLIFAFSGPVLWAVSTHLDKYLVERFFKDSDVAVLLVFTALMGLIALPLVGWWVPETLAVKPASAVLMALSGLLYMGALLFYLQALQSDEASVVAPFFQASPLFSYVLGYVVLGEALSAIQMLGGLLIIGGTVLVSLRFGTGRGIKGSLVALMLGCALMLSFSSLLFKVFSLRDDFWPTTFWMFVGEAIFGAGLLAIPSYRTQFVRLLRASPGAVLSINAANELINLGGGLGTRFALLLAPMSLVQAIGSTTTLFVFLIGIGLSAFSPSLSAETLGYRDLVRKGAAAALVALGVMLVTR